MGKVIKPIRQARTRTNVAKDFCVRVVLESRENGRRYRLSLSADTRSAIKGKCVDVSCSADGTGVRIVANDKGHWTITKENTICISERAIEKSGLPNMPVGRFVSESSEAIYFGIRAARYLPIVGAGRKGPPRLRSKHDLRLRDGRLYLSAGLTEQLGNPTHVSWTYTADAIRIQPADVGGYKVSSRKYIQVPAALQQHPLLRMKKAILKTSLEDGAIVIASAAAAMADSNRKLKRAPYYVQRRIAVVPSRDGLVDIYVSKSIRQQFDTRRVNLYVEHSTGALLLEWSSSGNRLLSTVGRLVVRRCVIGPAVNLIAYGEQGHQEGAPVVYGTPSANPVWELVPCLRQRG